MAELSSELAEQLLRIGGGIGKKVEFTRGCIHLKQGGHCKKQTPMSTTELTTENPGITDALVKLGAREEAKINEKKREKRRLYYENNKEKVKEYHRRWNEKHRKTYYQQNKEKIKAYNRQNKEKKRVYNKTFYEKNKERLKKAMRTYRQKNN